MFEFDNKTISVNINWEADEKRDRWELCGYVTVSDPVKAKFSKWYRPDSYELNQLDSSNLPEDIYRQLQEAGFLGWEKELPQQTTGGWGYFYSNSRAEKFAKQTDTKLLLESVLAVGKRMELCTDHIELLKQIVSLVHEVKEKRPTVSAREHYYGY